MRSVSMKIKPRRELDLVDEESAARYSVMECWDWKGLVVGSYQAKDGRWDLGKRWIWESIIGNGVGIMLTCFWSVSLVFDMDVRWFRLW